MASFESWIHSVDWTQLRADKAQLLGLTFVDEMSSDDIEALAERLVEFVSQVQDLAAMDLGVEAVYASELSPEDFSPP